MASSSAHPTFPRNYSALGSLADRSKFGASATGGAQQQTQREGGRGTDRERERIERERLEREGQEHLNQLSEEQREEINEAVSIDRTFSADALRANPLLCSS